MRDETVAIHGGYAPDSTKAVAVPIYQTIAHEFDDAAHAGAVFDLEMPGFHYNRLNNPTNDVLEHRLAALEGGSAAVVVSSGAAAVNYSILNLAATGDNIITTPQLYGSTYTLFAHVFPGQGIEVRFASDDRPECVEPLIDAHTKAVFCESVGNPALNVVDLEAVSELAHSHGIPLIVDNTIATPVYLKPIDHGADVVVHSLTKFVGGHGTTLGGAIIDAGRFPWSEHADRFPMFNRPEPAFHGVVYSEQFPDAPYAVRCRTVSLRNSGSTLSPFGAFLLLQGLETLAVRLERHESNTRAVARYLASDPRVSWLSYLGDPEFRYFELAQRYLKGHCPSIVTFGVAGGYDAGIRFFDSVKLFKRLVNMGDVKSLVAHPASTTHRQLSPEALAVVGVAPETIRLSIGLEHIDDLVEDIDQALSAAL
jgi:O-acetylhomoserine (thiol)-lyase